MSEGDIRQCEEWLDVVTFVDCRSGLYDEADMREAIEEIILVELGEPHPAMLEKYAERIRVGLRAHDAEERTWDEATANDCLDAAFADLQARGIVARQCVGITLQTGWAEIGQIAWEHEESGAEVRGCAFYHRQDLERGINGEGIQICFGPWESDVDEDWVEIGREVAHVLRHHGLKVIWNGTADSAIVIEPFLWRKRVHTASPLPFSPAPPLPPLERTPAAEPVAPCEICGGRGWVVRASGGGSELCRCQAG